MQTSNRQELEHQARVLSDQADRLIRQLGVDVSDAEIFSKYSLVLRQAADAYERLALAEKRTNQVAWERTMVDGRNGAETMDRLWKIRQALRRRDQEAISRKEP